MSEALVMVCAELGVNGPPDASISTALKEAQEALSVQPSGNITAQVKALVELLGISVPGWEPAVMAS